MIFNNKTKRVVAALLIISFLFMSAPAKTYAYLGFADIVIDPVNLVQNTISAIQVVKDIVKEFILDPLAWMIAKMMIQKITAQTVNWINSGFQGNPSFVTNPGRFFLDVGDQIASKYISGSALNNLCAPFKANVRLALTKNFLAETPGEYYSCTLGGIVDNFRNFTQDFSQGGWDSWFNVSQNSQSNPFGTYLDTKNQLSIEVGGGQFKYSKQLDWGKGFLSFERCEPGYNQSYSTDGINYTCPPDHKETVTPGSIIEGQLNAVLPKGMEGLVTADEISEIIGALITQLMTKIVGGGGSLRGDSYDVESAQRAFSQEFQQTYQNDLATVQAQSDATTNQITTQVNSEFFYPTPATSEADITSSIPTINVNCVSGCATYPTPTSYPTPSYPTPAYATPAYATPGGTYPTPSGNFYPTPSGSFYPTPQNGLYLTPENGVYLTPASGIYPTPTYLTPSYATPSGSVPPFPYPYPYPTPTVIGGAQGTTNWVRSFPVSGITALPIFWDGAPAPTSGSNFTVAASSGNNRACTAGLASLFQTNPGDPWVYRNEGVTYCGICNATTLICNQTHYYSCTIDYYNTTDPACP